MPYKVAIKIIVSLLFLGYVFFRVDVRQVFSSLSSVEPMWYVLSLLVPILNSFVLALKYKIVMRPSGIYQPVLRLLQINLMCRFYSMFLTTAIGQGVIRWHLSTKNQEGRLKFLAVMFFERSTFLFALCLAFALSVLLLPDTRAQDITDSIYPFVIAGLSGLLLFYFFLNYAPLYQAANRFLSSQRTKSSNVLISKLSELVSTFSMYYNRRALLLSSLCFAIVWQLLFLLRMYLLIISLQVPLSLVHLVWMASLVSLLCALPISLDGIGLRETAYALLFTTLDLPPEQGVLTGVLCLSHMLFMSAIGGLLHLLSRE